MSRRVVFFIALISLAVVGTAASPWNLTGSRLSAALTEHVRDRYGLDLKVEGRSTFAILPIPRVKFEKVTLRFPDQAIRADGGTLRGELRLLPLIFGRVELADFDLSDSRLTGSVQALRSINWAEILNNRPDASYARRLVLTNSTIHWTDQPGANLDRLNLVIRWTDRDNPLTVSGSALWRDEQVTIEQASVRPDLLASDRISPFSLTLSAPFGLLSVTGEAQLGNEPRVTGESEIRASSIRDFARWSGADLPFGSLLQAMSVSGEFSMDRRRLSWPSVAVTLGSDKLEGSLGVRFEGERPLINGTLAADSLNLSDLVAPFAQARTPAGPWNDEAMDLAGETGSDLDLRLSANSAHLGRLKLGDMAASVLVRPGRIEASIGRAEFHDGTLKGRLSLASLGGKVEFKSQGTFSGVEISPFLNAIGQPRWITGRAGGQFSFEGMGKSPADVIRQVQGRSSIEVLDGELVGIALDDALKRVEKRPLIASLNWKGGRTPFHQAQAQIVMKDGVGEIVEGHLRASTVKAALQGEVLLLDRSLSMKADISPADLPAGHSPSLVFDVSGDWDSIVVKPDARSLIERSGAAKPLLPADRVPANEQRPQAVAQ
jgi:AsmA protein